MSLQARHSRSRPIRDLRAFAMTSTWCRRKYQRPLCCSGGRKPRSTSCRTRFGVTPRISAAPLVVVQYGWSRWAYRSSASCSTSARVEADPAVRDGLAEDAAVDEARHAELVDAEDL